MRTALSAVLLCALAAPASAAAQVSEIGAMTVPHAVIDADALGVGGATTTLAAVNAVGTNGGAAMQTMDFVANTAPPGIYSTNTQLGASLCLLAPDLGLCDLNTPAFDAFDVWIDFAGPSTEFGLGIADYMGNILLEFHLGGALVAAHVSSIYFQPDAKIYRVVGGFDAVSLKATSGTANWCIPELVVEQVTPSGPTLTVTAACPGSGSANLAGLTPGGTAYLGWSVTLAAWPIPVGACAGTLLDLQAPALLAVLVADAAGSVSLPVSVPPAACGQVHVQGFDLAGCAPTGVVSL